MAIETKSVHNIDISKQGIDYRFNGSAIKYIQSLVSKILSNQISEMIETSWFNFFSRVILGDSSRIDLPERLKDWLPGFGGGSSKAGTSIQYEFELKTGQVSDISINSAKTSDSKYAWARMDCVLKGDLIIRDLGYFALKFFIAANKVGAFFISKLNAKINVYEKKQNQFIELDFKCLYKTMKEKDIKRLNKHVYIGKNEKFPVRLIIELMPDDVLNRRLKKVNKYNKNKGYKTSDDYRDRSRFNLFITNIPDEIMTEESISKIYKVRWQIELVFKIWKSTFGLDNITPMKYERLMCTLYARLLLVLLNWEIFMIQRGIAFKNSGKLLSIMKCFSTLKENSSRIRYLLIGKPTEITKWIRWTENIFKSRHWLEKKKNKIGLEEILYLNIL